MTQENAGLLEPEFLKVVERIKQEDADDRELRASGVVQTPEEGLWAIHPDSIELLHIVVQSAGFKKIMEVGVSHGYSTVWLAHAARLTGGRLTALEVNPKSIEIASRNLAEAGLSDYVDFVQGDAIQTLRTLDGPFEFILLDCWDRLYPEMLPHVMPLLGPNGLMATDNVDPHDPASAHFRRLLQKYPFIQTVNVPLGNGGLEVSTRRDPQH